MALTLKNPEVEALAAELAALTGKSKTEAVRQALLDRRDRLLLAQEGIKKQRLEQFLKLIFGLPSQKKYSASQFPKPISNTFWVSVREASELWFSIPRQSLLSCSNSRDGNRSSPASSCPNWSPSVTVNYSKLTWF